VLGRKLRRDTLITEDGCIGAAWGMRLHGIDPARPDGLLLLYGLKPRPGLPSPLKYAPDVTHEFSVYGIDGGEQIRFDRNMWRQPELKPVLPASVAFQFSASSDEEAIERIQAVLDEALEGKAFPNVSEDWFANFPDAVDLSKPMLVYDDPATDLRIVDDGKIAVWRSER